MTAKNVSSTKLDSAPELKDEVSRKNKATLRKLPEGEREGAWEKLKQKSGKVCHLCEQPLPPDLMNVDVDHVIARAAGGETKLSNLYLAHASCNRSRGALTVGLAKPVIKFSRWCTGDGHKKTFGDVAKKYVPGGSQNAKAKVGKDKVTFTFNGQIRAAELFVDPATGVKYGFLDVPVEFVINDEDTQPRHIEDDHVRALALDFSEHPVHEPSNCRLVPVDGSGGLVQLLQFDGQHKTTAQIILGRTEIPMKIYVEPDPDMLQQLVVTIQGIITKRGLSTSDTLRKLRDVVKAKILEYEKANNGQCPTEVELIEFQAPVDQKRMKKVLLEDFLYAIYDDKSSKLSSFASTKRDPAKPFTDKTVINKLIKPLLSQGLFDQPLDKADRRDVEREQILMILNAVEEQMLTEWDPQPKGGDPESVATIRARNFFYEGAITWWVRGLLLPTIQSLIPKAKWEAERFTRKLDENTEEKLLQMIEVICSYPVWSDPNEEQKAALRSNTLTSIEAAFSEYNNVTLMDAIRG